MTDLSKFISAAALGDRAHEMFTAIKQLAAPDGGPVRMEAEYLVIDAVAGAAAGAAS